MAGVDFQKLRFFLPANLPFPGASGMEVAPFGKVIQIGNHSGDFLQSLFSAR
jgi:hypothetical protein